MFAFSTLLSFAAIFLLGFGYFSSSSSSNYSESPIFLPIPTSTPNDQRTLFLPPENPTTRRLPLILAYNKFFGSSFFGAPALAAIKKCPFQCRYSERKELYPQADVAIFHAREFRMDEMLASNYRPERLNVFYSLEAAPNEKLTSKKIPKDFFNVSMTFRKDSTIWRPYDKLQRIQPDDRKKLVWSDEEIDKMIEKKNELALQFVSNCATSSRREKYLSALQKITNITIYGKCNNNILSHDRTIMDREFEKHYFYLAFENAICEDYVTEKFWRLKGLIVPVVLKRSILKGIIEDENFIAADDFNSPEELIERMENLTQNHQEYKKYFGWTKKYRKTTVPANQLDDFCRLCEMATKKEKHSIEDIYQWWEKDAKCIPKFGRKLLGKVSLF